MKHTQGNGLCNQPLSWLARTDELHTRYFLGCDPFVRMHRL